uniref:Uncharacterized protein n=1 Tax=viral metagenome TaxID=1070528 RepID=A0A6H1ZU84_9ZZZZ
MSYPVTALVTENDQRTTPAPGFRTSNMGALDILSMDFLALRADTPGILPLTVIVTALHWLTSMYPPGGCQAQSLFHG